MKILLADYYGMCDKYGNEVGHSSKVLQEYTEILSNQYEVSCIVSPCIRKEIDENNLEEVITLKYNILTENSLSIAKRILDKIKLFINLNKVFKEKGSDILWFYRSDFFLFLYMLIFRPKHDKKRVCLIYQNEFGGFWTRRLIKKIFDLGMNQFDLVIYTNPNMKLNLKNKFYMPDYLYRVEKYKQYNKKKKNCAVCLGTISPYKKIEQLVESFKGNNYILEIAGFFFEEKRYKNIISDLSKNITVTNVKLSNEEYYRKLGSAKFCVLPYDMNQYIGRTSGVLQECIFLDVIPIAPEELLTFNGIYGIGYDELGELTAELLEKDYDSIIQKNRMIRDSVYEYDKVSDNLKKTFAQI